MSDQPPPPLGDQDLTKALIAAKRPVNGLTMGLVIAAVVIVAFVGGVFTHKAVAGSGSAPAAARQGAPGGGYRLGGGQGGQGAPGGYGSGARPGGGATVGTIDHVDGSTVYVKTRDGQLVKVATSAGTQVEVSSDGKVADLKPGATVAVQGQAAGSGSVTARSITEQPAAR